MVLGEEFNIMDELFCLPIPNVELEQLDALWKTENISLCYPHNLKAEPNISMINQQGALKTPPLFFFSPLNP